jgi:hypothetical protein
MSRTRWRGEVILAADVLRNAAQGNAVKLRFAGASRRGPLYEIVGREPHLSFPLPILQQAATIAGLAITIAVAPL